MTKRLHGVARVFGYWQFTINTDNPRRVRFKILDCLRFIAMLLLYVVCVYIEYFWDSSIQLEDESNLEFFSSLSTIFAELFIIPYNMLCDILNRHRLWTIIMFFNDFDATVNHRWNTMWRVNEMTSFLLQMSKYGLRLNYRLRSSHFYLGLILAIFAPFCCLVCAYAVIYDATIPIGITLAFVFAYIDCSHATVAFAFQFLLINVRQRFQFINDTLRYVQIEWC